MYIGPLEFNAVLEPQVALLTCMWFPSMHAAIFTQILHMCTYIHNYIPVELIHKGVIADIYNGILHLLAGHMQKRK